MSLVHTSRSQFSLILYAHSESLLVAAHTFVLYGAISTICVFDNMICCVQGPFHLFKGKEQTNCVNML